jgi:hypothetical protein
MEPTLSEGDIIYVVPKNPSKISIGDIVVFEVRNIIYVHRVVNLTYVDDVRCFITKGDANPYTDQEYGIPPLKPREINGVLLSLNGWILKIPKIGIIYVVGNNFILYWTSGRITLMVPSVMLGLAVIMPLGTKQRKSIYPFSRTPITKKVVGSIILFTLILHLLSALPLIYFRLHSYSISLGVETQSYNKVDFNLGSLKPGTGKNITVTLYALSAIPISSRGFAYIEGNITQLLTIQNETITIAPSNIANRIEISAYAPLNASQGVYTGKLFVYNRPIWILFPFYKLINLLSSNNLLNLLILDTLSNFIIAGCLAIFQLLFLTFSNHLADTIIWNYSNHEWVGWKVLSYGKNLRSILKNIPTKMKNMLVWKKIKKILSVLTDEATYLPLHIVPILLFLCLPSLLGHILIGLLLSSIFTSAYIVFIKRWVWKSDIAMISITSSIVASTYYVIQWAMINDRTQGVWSTFSFLGPLVYLSLICLLVTVPTTYFSSYLALKWIARNPARSLNTLGDWDVVP